VIPVQVLPVLVAALVGARGHAAVGRAALLHGAGGTLRTRQLQRRQRVLEVKVQERTDRTGGGQSHSDPLTGLRNRAF
jgi:hypothetical protein